jgi:RNA polymerase sigma-70 factor (ECF subfamily)
VLDPDVILRSDGGPRRPGQTIILHGPEAVASRAMTFAHGARHARPALVNGAAGVVITPAGRPVSVIGFTVRDGRIVAMDALSDPERLAQLDFTVLDDPVT